MNIEDIRKELNGTKVHAFIVQKGGTGKTTSCSSVAYAMAQKGFKVLVIDSDSQASLSGLCGILPQDEDNWDEEPSVLTLQDIFDYYKECLTTKTNPRFEAIKEVIIRPTYNAKVRKNVTVDGRNRFQYEDEKIEFGFDLIPADITLANAELMLGSGKYGAKSGFALLNIIEVIKENTDYDYILIDCPPALGMLATNALAASVDGCIIPINLEVMTLRGCQNVIEVVAEMQGILQNSGIVHKGVLGILKNEYNPRFVSQRDFNSVVDKFFPIPSFETTIPQSSNCNAAHSIGKLYSQYDSKARVAFDKLVDEIVNEDIRRAGEKESIIVNKLGAIAKQALEGVEGE
ncbi:MAG: AAA family ATPase [Erysipelotrichaceae bacterium]|nr:AAA family ATPase [Erysipelotrichaceae bacterium]